MTGEATAETAEVTGEAAGGEAPDKETESQDDAGVRSPLERTDGAPERLVPVPSLRPGEDRRQEAQESARDLPGGAVP